MKKFSQYLFWAASLCAAVSLSGCSGKSKTGLTPVTLNEVAHSVFYAPQYAAIELGYFTEEGLDLTLVNGAGADKVMTALLSGDADIGFMGSEASIYTFAQDAPDYAVNFAQLTQRAGNFLVARQPDPSFSWQKLKGKTVLGGRAGGMPQMVFEYILKKNGIDPQKDLPEIPVTIRLSLNPLPQVWSWRERAMWLPPSVQIPAMFPTLPTVPEKAIWMPILTSFRNSPMHFKKECSM